MADETLDEGEAIPIVTSAVDYPTIFADHVWFATLREGVVRITFAEALLEPTNSPNPGAKMRHVGTLAMPLAGFQNMIAYLSTMDQVFLHQTNPDATD